jgi:hypothetical protein
VRVSCRRENNATGFVSLSPQQTAIMNKTRPTSRNKDHRKDYLRCRAKELAMSGRFERWQGIEFELTFVEGLPEARTLLSGRAIRETRTIAGRSAPDNLAPLHSGNPFGNPA